MGSGFAKKLGSPSSAAAPALADAAVPAALPCGAHALSMDAPAAPTAGDASEFEQVAT